MYIQMHIRKNKTEKGNMGMGLLLRIFALVLVASQSFTTASPSISFNSDKPSAYELLEGFDFPIGILPKGIVDYDLDNSTGKFTANWSGTCSFSLEGSYQLKYRSSIQGYISKGKLTRLEGVSVKLFFVWVNIVEVLRKGDNLAFSVGIASADFSIDNFEECPQCGCGLNCNGGRVSKLRTNPFVSSY